MNEYDIVLYWLSARKNGEIGINRLDEVCLDFAKSRGLFCEQNEQDNKPKSGWRHKFIEPLLRLGHVEELPKKRYGVVPTVAIWRLQEEQVEVIFYGARSQSLLKKLQDKAGDRFRCERQEQGPERWSYIGPKQEAEELANSIGASFHKERSLDWLRALPSLSQATHQFEVEENPPSKLGLEYFKIRFWKQSVRWEWASEASKEWSNGVYRVKGGGGARWFFVQKKDFQEPVIRRLKDLEQSRVARWFCLIREGNLRLLYDPEARILGIPSLGVQLPLLLDRGLYLASGYSPQRIQHNSQWWSLYQNISQARAKQVKRILGIEMEESEWKIQ